MVALRNNLCEKETLAIILPYHRHLLRIDLVQEPIKHRKQPVRPPFIMYRLRGGHHELLQRLLRLQQVLIILIPIATPTGTILKSPALPDRSVIPELVAA